jgi:hypothetical protein
MQRSMVKLKRGAIGSYRSMRLYFALFFIVLGSIISLWELLRTRLAW